MTAVSFVTVMAVLGLVVAPGCYGYVEVESPTFQPDGKAVTFSPDGKNVAYVWSDTIESVIPFWIDTMGAATAEYVGYCRTDGPSEHRLVRFHEHAAFPGSAVRHVVRYVAFSPTSTHLAILCRHSLHVIELATGLGRRLSPLGQGEVTSFRWLSGREVVYGFEFGPEAWPDRRTLFRQRIDGDACRVVLFTRPGNRAPFNVFRERWSPDGSRALIRVSKGVRLLEVATGKVSPPLKNLRSPEMSSHVMWRPDGAVALYCYKNATGSRTQHAFLIESSSLLVKDLTARFRDLLGRNRSWEPELWTGEGKYVVVTGMKTCLIRLDPWQAVRFEDQYGRDMPVRRSGYRTIEYLRPGWLRLVDDRMTRSAFGDRIDSLAVDYQGKRVVPISKRPIAISPDGTRFAEVVRKGKVIVKPLDLPAEPPASHSAAREVVGATRCQEE